jgi:F0F1-type ATP synthase assembly protein I
MQKTDSISDLKDAIRRLEVEQSVNGRLLKEQFRYTYDSLRPANLIRSTLKELSSSPFTVENLAGTVVGLTTGYLSKKIFIGASANIFRKILGGFIQLGVTNIFSKNSDVIESFGRNIVQHFRNKKHTDS